MTVLAKSTLKNYQSVAFHSVVTFLGQSLLMAVDLLFCRSLGPEATAAVGAAASQFSWFLILGIGVISATEFLIPHAIGEKNEPLAHTYFNAGVWVAVGLAIFSTLGLLSLNQASTTLGFHTDIVAGLSTINQIIAWSYLPVFLSLVFRVELQGRNQAHIATHAYIVGNAVNLFLNWALVFGNAGFPKLGLAGTAWANVVSRIVIAIYIGIGLWVLFPKRSFPSFLTLKKMPVMEIFRLGFPAYLHLTFEMGAFIFASFLAARMAPSQAAAHSIVLTIVGLTFMIPLGLGSAAAVTISKALGAHHFAEANRLGTLSIQIGLGFSMFSGAFYLFYPNLLIGFFTDDSTTLTWGQKIIFIVALFQIGDALQVILAGCLRGYGITTVQAKVNAVGHWIIGIPLALLMAFTFKLEVMGLWIGLCVGLWSVSFGLLYFWRRIQAPT